MGLGSLGGAQTQVEAVTSLEKLKRTRIQFRIDPGAHVIIISVWNLSVTLANQQASAPASQDTPMLSHPDKGSTFRAYENVEPSTPLNELDRHGDPRIWGLRRMKRRSKPFSVRDGMHMTAAGCRC